MIKIQLATFKPKTAQEIFARLPEKEKFAIRGASPDRLTWLGRNTYFAETGGDEKVIKELSRMCEEEFLSISNSSPWWFKPTYRF
jgi:hypothetical protein